jgi:hypothetical protein
MNELLCCIVPVVIGLALLALAASMRSSQISEIERRLGGDVE